MRSTNVDAHPSSDEHAHDGWPWDLRVIHELVERDDREAGEAARDEESSTGADESTAVGEAANIAARPANTGAAAANPGAGAASRSPREPEGPSSASALHDDWRRTLHDEVLHHLVAARDALAHDPDRAQAQIQLAIVGARQLCESPRDLIELPGDLDLVLRRVAREVIDEGAHGAPVVTVEVQSHPPIGQPQLDATAGAVREALRNVARHTPSGTATRVRGAPTADGGLRVSVVDRGGGPSRDLLDGFGVRVSIVERVASVGGHAQVEPLDDGVRVLIWMPTAEQ
ncbi:hypothetical protein ER308_14905 [Egibacter rhizosphaerae]|uniref:Histidine kinase/HSP90-like ATPase domain-containing protein n=1 Tax=Egibacter rhizosphaerae TaxID=1670831 RepID=A0A411YHN2_9ACTN|nr:ATP-binding protein [Egibacter rhizosphaerae]QBI20723.1 hypothetical protein ER308_14905 [Egibacter rhizosphaerae]